MKRTLFDELSEYRDSGFYPFHMPGHKRRLSPEGLEAIYGMDITEIDGFDNLHDACGILADMQSDAADLFHSEETHFLVNGSTCGILAAISAVCRRGDQVLVARNCHKSVYHAIEVLGLKPVYIYPPLQKCYRSFTGVYPQIVNKMWIKTANIQAIILTSPTYEGITSDIHGIVTMAHERGIPVIVDEAHGAHMTFSEYFPESAVTLGADLVVQSTHKTLPMLTQTALLHVNGKLVNRERLRHMLGVYQTSSPSYILMGSIDAGLKLIRKRGDELFEEYTRRLIRARGELKGLKHIHLLDKEDLDGDLDHACSDGNVNTDNVQVTDQDNNQDIRQGNDSPFEKLSFYPDLDRSKLVLYSGRISGHEMADRLRADYKIEPEMCGENFVLLMTSIGDDDEGFERLVRSMKEIDRGLDETDQAMDETEQAMNEADQAMDEADQAMDETDQAMDDGRTAWSSPVDDTNVIKNSIDCSDTSGCSDASNIIAKSDASDIADASDTCDSSGSSDLSDAYDRLTPPVAAMGISDALWSDMDRVLLDEAEGRISGEYVYLYPPGIPIVTPGEIIDGQIVDTIRRWLSLGMHVSGIEVEQAGIFLRCVNSHI